MAVEFKEVTKIDTESPSGDFPENIDPDDALTLYLKEASRTPLLTAEEEVELAKRIEAGREARAKLAEGANNPRRREEFRLIAEDGWNARQHLIKANGRLVINIAKKYMGRGVPFLDMIQEGNIGLIRSVKKFDYRRGLKLSTYATWWITQSITLGIADQGRTIRVPVNMHTQINRLWRVSQELIQRLDREPTTEELAAELNQPLKKVEDLIRYALHSISLEEPTGDESNPVLGDFIEDEDSPSPVKAADKSSLREQLRSVLHTLPPREVQVLQLRYGLNDGTSYTLQKVGRMMGVTRERVRQIQVQALSRLRHPGTKLKLRDWLEK